MGKKLVIKGADFSANAVETDFSWVTVLEGSITQDSASSLKYIDLDSILPAGTVTRLTQKLTGAGTAACGVEDTNDVTHSGFWRGTISSETGTVSDEKELTFDIKRFVAWVEDVGSKFDYKLEVKS